MCNGKGDQLGPFRFSGFRSSLKPNQTAVIGAGEWVENLFNPFQHLSFCFHRVGESNPRSEDNIEHPTGSTAWGKRGLEWKWKLWSVFHRFYPQLLPLFRSRFVNWLAGFATKKPPQSGGMGIGWAEGLEAHHLGDRSELRSQIGMEGGVVVLNGAVGVFETVAGQDTHDGGACGHFVFAFEQTCH